jgi:hypothetical protein
MKNDSDTRKCDLPRSFSKQSPTLLRRHNDWKACCGCPVGSEPKSGSIAAQIAAVTFIGESDWSPAECGVAGGVFVAADLPPPGSSIFENGMFQ